MLVPVTLKISKLYATGKFCGEYLQAFSITFLFAQVFIQFTKPTTLFEIKVLNFYYTSFYIRGEVSCRTRSKFTAVQFCLIIEPKDAPAKLCCAIYATYFKGENLNSPNKMQNKLLIAAFLSAGTTPKLLSLAVGNFERKYLKTKSPPSIRVSKVGLESKAERLHRDFHPCERARLPLPPFTGCCGGSPIKFAPQLHESLWIRIYISPNRRVAQVFISQQKMRYVHRGVRLSCVNKLEKREREEVDVARCTQGKSYLQHAAAGLFVEPAVGPHVGVPSARPHHVGRRLVRVAWRTHGQQLLRYSVAVRFVCKAGR